MLTRRKIRSAAVHFGLAIGALGLLIYLLSPFLAIGTAGSLREVEVGHGALTIGWYGGRRTTLRPVAGAAPLAVREGGGAGRSVGGSFGRDRPIIPDGVAGAVPVEGQYFPAERIPRPREWSIGRPASDHGWRWLPRFTMPERAHASRRGQFVLPAWLFLLIGGWCLYLRLPSDTRPGFCPRCNFDLRSTPPMKENPKRVRCPECGGITKKVATTP